jgi:hypothetical protein
MLPMWISPDGEMPDETTTGLPEAMAASAASSAQCRATVSPLVIPARYIAAGAAIKKNRIVLEMLLRPVIETRVRGFMERINLRDAARQTARSVTTLRRYIRSGRLRADKLPGRFGPEYFVTAEQLASAGLEPPSPETASEDSSAPGASRTALASRSALARVTPLDRVLRESVPITLFQDLQLKHEQLLVQYGMVRAGGLRVLEMQAEIESRRRQIEDAQAENTRVKERLAREAGDLRKRLREAELELEGRRVEAAALREKVRGLEMLTRNSVTNEEIDRQFSDVMEQIRRVDRLTAEHDVREPGPGRHLPHPDPEH